MRGMRTSLAHADEAVAALAGRAGADGRATAVAHGDRERVAGPVQPQVGGRAGGMPAHVGQRLLDDPVGRQVERAVQGARLAVLLDGDGEAGRPGAVEQRGELAEPRLGRERPRVTVLAQHAEEPAHLPEGLAGGAADRGERPAPRLPAPS
jgi:hypothetical protein